MLHDWHKIRALKVVTNITVFQPTRVDSLVLVRQVQLKLRVIDNHNLKFQWMRKRYVFQK